MGRRKAVEVLLDRRLKRSERRMVAAVEGASFEELPQTFDQVQVGRVRGQEQERDPQLNCQRLHRSVPLIAGVVQYQGDRSGETRRGDLSQQFAHRLGVDDRGVRHGDQFARHRVPSSEHVEPLTTRSRADEDSLKRPQAAQERPEYEMGGVAEEHMTLSRHSRVQKRLQFGFEKLGLGCDMLGEVFFGGTGMARARCHFSPISLRNLRT
jgi:hypothetical protein